METLTSLIKNFRENYNDEIKPLLDSEEYVNAWLLIADPAEEMKKNLRKLAQESPYSISLVSTAYSLSQALGKYTKKPREKIKEEIKNNRKLLETAIKQSLDFSP